MILSSEKRREINRDNAKHSTGPKSDVGKARSCLNALKHGLRAETLALPNEDPAELAAREHEWNDYYRPRNPGEAYLVQQAVRATIQLDRCARFQTATVARQVRAAVERFDQGREDAVERCVEMLGDDPDDALRRLESTASGCRWLVEQWTELRDILGREGRWARDDLRCAKLLGGDFGDGRWLVEDPASPRPEAPERAAAVREAQRELTTHIDALRAREERLRTERDEPERDEAAERALLIEDARTARLFLRYQNSAHSVFFRAYAALTKALENGRVGADDAPVETAAEVAAPNEPKPAEQPPSTPSEPATSAEPHGSVSGPPAAPEVAPSAVEPSPDEAVPQLTEQNFTTLMTNESHMMPMNADQIRIP